MTNIRTEKQLIKHLNKFREPFLDDLGCTIVSVDPVTYRCEMDFAIGQRYCHSGDVIQGGFVAAMLDAVTTHTLFAAVPNIVGVSTLELKVSYLEASRKGTLRATGQILKMSRSIAFMSGELRDAEGVLTATISTTAKLRIAKT